MRRVEFIALFYYLLASLSASAILLDWDKLTWSGGSLSGTFYATNTANASTTSNRGILYADDAYSGVGSITITITGDTDAFQDDTPNDTKDAHGGTSEVGLFLHVNQDNDNDFVMVTVTFNGYSGGVSNVFFRLFDVDRYSSSSDNYIDQIRNLYARSNTGWAIAPKGVTGSSDNVVTGTGTNQVVTGTDQAASASSSGNVSIDFGTNYLTTFTFRYGNDAANTQSDPTEQWITLHDISFTPKPKVPEVGTSIAATACCCLMMWLKRRRSVCLA